jgi:hypothetical protein
MIDIKTAMDNIGIIICPPRNMLCPTDGSESLYIIKPPGCRNIDSYSPKIGGLFK